MATFQAPVPQKDTPSPADFPITSYDTPKFALMNMLKGNPSATMRSIFQQDTLSPEEMETIRSKWLPQVKNPILKTAMEISTNPLVWIGVALSIGFKTASPDMLYRLGRDAKQLANSIGPLAGWMHAPLARVRHIAGLADDLVGMVKATTDFETEVAEMISKPVKKYVEITGKRLGHKEELMLAAYLENWHKSTHSVKGLKAFKDVAIIPDLVAKMGPDLKSLGDSLKGVTKHVWSKVNTNSSFSKAMEAKGVTEVESYFPHMVSSSAFEYKYLSSMKEETYKQVMGRLTEAGRIAGNLKKRSVSLPAEMHLQDMVKEGILHPSFLKEVDDSVTRGVDQLRAGLKDILRTTLPEWLDKSDQASRYYLEQAFGASESGAIKKLMGVLKTQATGNVALSHLADEIIKVRKDPVRLAKTIDDIAINLGSPGRYGMKTMDTFNEYIRAMGPTYAWHVAKAPGAGIQTFKEVLLAKGSRLNTQRDAGTYDLYHSTLLPLLQGGKPYKQFHRDAAAKVYRMQVGEWLARDPIAQKYIPEGARNWMLQYFGNARGALSTSNVSSAISHYFYLSSLGLNIGSASKNVMQNFITTAAMLGPAKAMKGFGVISGRMGKFASLASKEGAEEAMRKVFPEYVEILGTDPDLASQLLSENLLASTRPSFTGAKTVAEKAKAVMMAPFAASEKFNRLWSFYTGLDAGKKAGLTLDQAKVFGRDLVGRTQFPGGPLGIPSGLLNIPSPLRQFMHFPLRYASFLHDSMSFGPDPTKMSLGTIGRALAISAGTYEVGRGMLGTDLSGGLMTGALPGPSYEGQPFYPFPLVPPMLGTIGSAVQAVDTGDYSKAGQAGAMLVPGGLAIRRAYRAIGPKFAKYSEKTEEGKVPLYNDKGTLIGAYSPWQLTKKAIGLSDLDAQGEQQMAGWLLAQRDRIREYRAKYLEALANSDTRGAQDISDAFTKQYPQLGELQVKKSDIKAVTNRRQVSRLNRIVKGIPGEYRPMFEKVMGDASFASMIQDLDKSPDVQTIQNYLTPPMPAPQQAPTYL